MNHDVGSPTCTCELCSAVVLTNTLVLRYVLRKHSNMYICETCLRNEQTMSVGQAVSSCDADVNTGVQGQILNPSLDGDLTLREAKNSGRRVFDDSIGIPLGGMEHQLSKIRDMFKCFSKK